MAAGDLVVAITGASGSPYAVRLLEVLLGAGRTVHLVISPAATQVIERELGVAVDLDRFKPAVLLGGRSESVTSLHYHHFRDFSAGIASGSFLTAGMAVCPCSLGTAAAIAHGLSENLIHRAADVHLKERRKLVLVPRETPLSAIHLQNMLRLTRAGAVILPAAPGFYNKPTSIADLVDFVVARVLDQLGVDHSLVKRWG